MFCFTLNVVCHLIVLNHFFTFQSAAATAATLALPAGVTPVQQIITNSGIS